MLAAATLVIGAATTADAASLRPVALWEMDETAGARTMYDDTGHGLNGTIGREVATGTRVSGATAYRFSKLEPDTPPARPRHLVTVPDKSALDPGERDYAVMIRLRTTYQFGNIIQKGQATVSGGSFKMQIPNGIVECLYRGAHGTIIVRSTRKLNDGRWHTVGCERLDESVELWVDGSRVARKYGHTGRISNSWPVSIGGKTDCDQVDVGCDYYAGDLDWIQINAG
jgi:hypothetical protein